MRIKRGVSLPGFSKASDPRIHLASFGSAPSPAIVKQRARPLRRRRTTYMSRGPSMSSTKIWSESRGSWC
eukprot:12208332-Heterocapsa_arctica.AAC.1